MTTQIRVYVEHENYPKGVREVFRPTDYRAENPRGADRHMRALRAILGRQPHIDVDTDPGRTLPV